MSLTLKPNQSLVGTSELLEAATVWFECINSPKSLSAYLMVKYHEYDQLVSMGVDPLDYTSASSFRDDYQVISLLRKADFLNTTFDRRKAALDTFWKAEEACKRTNLKFDFLETSEGLAALNKYEPDICRMLLGARHKIATILRELPEDLAFRFGPGVTQSVKKHVTRAKKYGSKLCVSPLMFPYLPDIVGPHWLKTLDEVSIVDGSRITFVPKDAKTDRTIAVEPDLNGYVQLGIGRCLRDRFRTYVDLNTGQDLNRFYASVAQEWRLSTIDLSSASDTISRSVVRFLLPEQWWLLLERARSHKFDLDGKTYMFEKFSSMGNGFTFELESIIFYALARAAGSHLHLTSSYGDDIICEAKVFDDLTKLLNFCGFTVNGKKSFRSGAFFESCGEDFFDGHAVRPQFWKSLKPQTAFSCANGVSRWSASSYGRDARYKPVYDTLVRGLPELAKRCLVPKAFGDVGLIVDWDVASPFTRRASNGHCGFITRAMKFLPRESVNTFKIEGYLASLDTGYPRSLDKFARIVGSTLAPVRDSEEPIESIRGEGVYSVGRSTTFGEWTGFGPWH